MKIIGIIPARYESSRFLGKPLKIICGKTMLQRVYDNAKCSKYIDQLFIATDDERILNEAKIFTNNVFMTSKKHQSGTERIEELARDISCNIVINIQGDEPTLSAKIIDTMIENMLENPKIDACTCCYPITNISDFTNKNIVKVVRDNNNFALYFSRSPIPYHHSQDNINAMAHIGIYAYRKEILEQYVTLQHNKLARIEKLEQLSLLENNIKLMVVEVQLDNPIISVNTPEDLKNAIQFIQNQT